MCLSLSCLDDSQSERLRITLNQWFQYRATHRATINPTPSNARLTIAWRDISLGWVSAQLCMPGDAAWLDSYHWVSGHPDLSTVGGNNEIMIGGCVAAAVPPTR